MFTSGLGAHLTWTLPFGLLIMFAVFNRFDGRYEEAARDLGATPWQTFRHVVLPMIAPSLVGIALFGFTLSWDEVARSSQALGSAQNTLPLELTGLTTTVTNPEIYALGTLTTGRVVRRHRHLAPPDPRAPPAPSRRAAARRRSDVDGDPRRQPQHHRVDDREDRRRRARGGLGRHPDQRGEPGHRAGVDRGLLRRGALACPGSSPRWRRARRAAWPATSSRASTTRGSTPRDRWRAPRWWGSARPPFTWRASWPGASR